MPKQIINVGTGPNAKNGDPIRNAFIKVNANFDEIYSQVSEIVIPEIPTDISQLTDNQGLLATIFDGGSAASEFNDEETIDGGRA
jgi:hypothetical protein